MISAESLILFEQLRKQSNYIPPSTSNSFHAIGGGVLNLYTINDTSDKYKFDLYTDSGEIHTGDGIFITNGSDDNDISCYKNIYIISNTSIVVDDMLMLTSMSSLDVYGTLQLSEKSSIVLENESIVILKQKSSLIIENAASIKLTGNSKINIYGSVSIHIDDIDLIYNNENIYLDPVAIVTVRGFDTVGRDYSITDYYEYLCGISMNEYTQGEKNASIGIIGYRWRAGNMFIYNQIFDIRVIENIAILGDLRLSVLGLPNTLVEGKQLVCNLEVEQDGTLYVIESFNDNTYYRPEIYVGAHIDNCNSPGKLMIYGTMHVSGEYCGILLDNNGSIEIYESGILYLENDSFIYNIYDTQNITMNIMGTLVIDSIEQLMHFNSSNIIFGPSGKLIINNPDTGERKLLFTTPQGIHASELYRLFEDSLDHIEYHISKNCGIGIDKHFDSYPQEMVEWYAGMRIEKAVHSGLIIWHDEAFIELYADVTPWATTSCTLYEASRIFKSFGSYDEDRLQEVVNRMKYAGFNNIIFRFVQYDQEKEVLLRLDDINIKNMIYNQLTDTYEVETDNDGILFLTNAIGEATVEAIIENSTRIEYITNNHTEFEI